MSFTTGAKFPGTGATVDRAGNNAWTGGTTNLFVDDNADASATTPTDYLVTSNYGFTVPPEATILGVTVRIEADESGTGNSNYIPQLNSDATPTLIGSAKSAVTVSGGTPVVSTNGSASDLWGATLTPAIVNATGFGCTIWSTDTVNVLNIDYFTIEIEYDIWPVSAAMAPMAPPAKAA